MAIKADMKYNGKIAEGSYFYYSSQGSLALNIRLECEDGTISFPLWLTEKNKERAVKTLTSLGADPAKLGNQNYLDNELPGVITGKEVSFGTKEETYNDKTTIKVSWIGKATDPNVVRGAASFFGGGGAPTAKDRADEITDDDIPF
jgi:hypothetical protein